MTGNFSSLEEFYDEVARKFLEECVFCGQCMDNCPLVLVLLKDTPSQRIMEEVASFLKDGEHSEEVYLKAFACTLCAECSNVCPQGIDVMEVFCKVRNEFFKRGRIPDALKFFEKEFVNSKGRSDFLRVLSAIQFKPSEIRWLRKVPSKPKQTENLLFLGCIFTHFPHITLPLLDILESTGIDFMAIAGDTVKDGKTLCCGFPFAMSGNIKQMEKDAKGLISAFKLFSPKTVITTCESCHRFITKIYNMLFDMDFKVEYCAEFLLDNIDKIEFKKRIEKTVYFQDSCSGRSAKVDTYSRRLLEKIPGVKVVKGQRLCCGGTPKRSFIEFYKKNVSGYREALAGKIMESKCEILTFQCPNCELAFSPHVDEQPFAVKNVLALINEAIGGRIYENRWLKYWKCKNEDEIIKVSREYFEANGMSEDEARKALPFILSWK
ncbi:MAG: (Fe-S)-binding protein [Candidatus Bathyarchaeia archaeon]